MKGSRYLLALALEQIPLSDVAGLVARGEAVGGDEAEELEAARQGRPRRPFEEPIYDQESDLVEAAIPGCARRPRSGR